MRDADFILGVGYDRDYEEHGHDHFAPWVEPVDNGILVRQPVKIADIEVLFIKGHKRSACA